MPPTLGASTILGATWGAHAHLPRFLGQQGHPQSREPHPTQGTTSSTSTMECEGI